MTAIFSSTLNLMSLELAVSPFRLRLLLLGVEGALELVLPRRLSQQVVDRDRS